MSCTSSSHGTVEQIHVLVPQYCIDIIDFGVLIERFFHCVALPLDESVSSVHLSPATDVAVVGGLAVVVARLLAAVRSVCAAIPPSPAIRLFGVGLV
jgi:hypothetical protein